MAKTFGDIVGSIFGEPLATTEPYEKKTESCYQTARSQGTHFTIAFAPEAG